MNSVVHFEVPADDLERAKKFYGSVFGWQLMDMGPNMGNYVLATTTESDQAGPKKPGAINGGMMKRTENKKAPIIVIDVENIDEHVKKVEMAGGKIIEPKMPVGDMGLLAYVTDTEGNLIGVWQNLK